MASRYGDTNDNGRAQDKQQDVLQRLTTVLLHKCGRR